jgi:peptidoglycan/LPS O-acetylase OafA/YrhL
MTPIIGLLIAVLAGFLAPGRRAVLAGVIPPMLAVTAAQSWYLGTGRGHNPPATTTDSPAYWVVQLVILALICGVAVGIYAVRARRAARRGAGGASGAADARRRPLGPMLAAGTVAALAGTLALMFATDRPSHPGGGHGNLPVTGVAGIAVALAAIAVFAVLWLRSRPARGGADAHQLAR